MCFSWPVSSTVESVIEAMRNQDARALRGHVRRRLINQRHGPHADTRRVGAARRDTRLAARQPAVGVRTGLPPRFDDLADEVAFGREWQAKLASGRWVGVGWPRELGGRGAGRSSTTSSPRSSRGARAGARRPDRREPRRADPARARHARTAIALAPEDPRRVRDLVPALQRTGRGERPDLAHDARPRSTAAGC